MTENIRLLPAAIRAREDEEERRARQAVVVQVLEDLAARARSGEVSCIAAVVGLEPVEGKNNQPGDFASVYAVGTTTNVVALLGTLDVLRHRVFFGQCVIPELP